MRTQIHLDGMTTTGVYAHGLIRSVDELWLGPDGVIGVVDGQAMLHAHHRLHPNKNRAKKPKAFLPNRLLSFGFTSHYAAMADRFGTAELGCAAEDVIVEHDETIALGDLAGGMQLRRGEHIIEFGGAAVAKPCVPFTKFLLGNQDADDATVAPNRAFLEHGMRGFLVGLAEQTTAVDIRVGDELWLRD